MLDDVENTLHLLPKLRITKVADQGPPRGAFQQRPYGPAPYRHLNSPTSKSRRCSTPTLSGSK